MRLEELSKALWRVVLMMGFKGCSKEQYAFKEMKKLWVNKLSLICFEVKLSKVEGQGGVDSSMGRMRKETLHLLS